MDKKIAGMLGAVAGIATLGAAQATPVPTKSAPAPDPVAATSYADLLTPVPNALEALKVDNAARAQSVHVDGVQLARYYHHHHHHDRRNRHHHSRWWYRHHHHHHHHHRHHGAFIGIPGVGGIVVHNH